jgi:hypothetical protein
MFSERHVCGVCRSLTFIPRAYGLTPRLCLSTRRPTPLPRSSVCDTKQHTATPQGCAVQRVWELPNRIAGCVAHAISRSSVGSRSYGCAKYFGMAEKAGTSIVGMPTTLVCIMLLLHFCVNFLFFQCICIDARTKCLSRKLTLQNASCAGAIGMADHLEKLTKAQEQAMSKRLTTD